jgi:undecaprenyl diphosphate synthase
MGSKVPTHVGFIVDGNRRWAKAQGLPTLEGHRRGRALVKKALRWCLSRGVQYVSFYIFSTENWNRTQEEVSYLMKMAKTEMRKLARELQEEGVQLKVLGTRERLEKEIADFIDEAEEMTAGGDKGTVCVCFNYGGQQEIADAFSRICTNNRGKLVQVSVEDVRENLYHPEVPDVDLVVRTSGEERISGFMLWRAAYAEMLFVEKNWPDMTEADVEGVLEEYASRARRFGK